MLGTLPSIALGLLVSVAAAGAAVAGQAASDGDKMTICHIPPGNPHAKRTMEISEEAWSSHEGHGDHQGACAAAEARPPSTAKPAELPRTAVALRQHGDGDLDGDASFDVSVANRGSHDAVDVRVSGPLSGDGTWSVRATGAASCVVSGGHLYCDVGNLPAGSRIAVTLEFDGPPGICHEVATDLALTAANDSSRGDDRSRERVHAGVCAPLDPDAAPFPA